ncbi:serine hydrolase domain-containing protein [Halorussus caseinilyticus]|uniref:serine hydrolase domain-containing protein n=1 Tax=Halorussus caseinilyticus TaxID=3034025 RepID=UPI0023E8B187|nr:serine hydrolase domain-containing protein [Halorussus sp. DT72]
MTNRTRILTLVATCLLVAAQVGPVLAAPPTELSNRQDETRGVDSREEVETFVDEQMTEDMKEHRFSGATVSVVKDGEILFSEGYGYADRRNETPVVANRTMFRIGSVSKPILWTAVMQQVERGNIDTNASVNRYLDRIHVPKKYGEPVTVEHLATHTPGFEAEVKGIMLESPEDVQPLGKSLSDVPARVRPPGEATSYSNYGAALAGHIVARQADTTFPRYIDRRIYEPLNMTHSTFRQPVPAEMPGTLSKGYQYKNGEYVPQDFEAVATPPAGAMSATATDMGKFMIAHLQDGRYGDARILSESSAERMHTQQYTNHPALNGMTFGLMEQSRNGVRILAHGGDTRVFHSGMWLFPERDLGVFVSYNGNGGVPAREEFFDSFMNRYFPTEGTPTATEDGAASGPSLSAFTGPYRTTRFPHTTFLKPISLNSHFRVRKADNGTLVTSAPRQGTRYWTRTGPTVFSEVGGDGKMAFRVEDGRATYVFFDSAAPQSFERIPFWEFRLFQGGLFGGALVVFLSGILGWPGAALWRRWRGSDDGPTQASSATSDRPRAARWLAGFAGLLGLGFLGGFVGLAATNPTGLLYFPGKPALLFAVPWLVGATTLGVVAFAVLAWKDRYWGLVGRLHYTLFAVALAAFVWQLSYWNMLGL